MKNNYIKKYNSVINNIINKLPKEVVYESTLLGYTHRNKFIAWIFWKRIFTALWLAKRLKNKTVLDFGCGAGVTFLYLSEQNAKITGCDSDTFIVLDEICQQLHIKAEIFRDLFDIKNRTFDFIFALDVLEHLDDLDTYLNKIKEITHEHSELIISGPTENFLYKAGRLVSGFGSLYDSYHIRNIYDIEKSVAKAGFTLQVVKKLFFPFVLFRVTSWRKLAH